MCEWGKLQSIEIRLIDDSYKKIVVDSCLADIICTLNKIGLHTVSSCCGHGKQGISIIFQNGQLLHGNLYEIYDKTLYDKYYNSLSNEEKCKYTLSGNLELKKYIEDLERSVQKNLNNRSFTLKKINSLLREINTLI